MKKNITIFIWFIILLYSNLISFSQVEIIEKLVYNSYSIIPFQYDFEGVIVGGISGIENFETNKYLLISDAPRESKATIFNVNIEILEDTVKWFFNNKMIFKEKNVRPESIRKNKKTDEFYITDERSEISYFSIFDWKKKGRTKKLFKVKHIVNNGLEGFCFDNDFTNAFLSIEMLKRDDSMTVITEYNLETKKNN